MSVHRGPLGTGHFHKAQPRFSLCCSPHFSVNRPLQLRAMSWLIRDQLNREQGILGRLRLVAPISPRRPSTGGTARRTLPMHVASPAPVARTRECAGSRRFHHEGRSVCPYHFERHLVGFGAWAPRRDVAAPAHVMGR